MAAATKRSPARCVQRLSGAALGVLAAFAPVAGGAAEGEDSEFALFRITDVSGYFALRGLRDEATSRFSGAPSGGSTTVSTIQSDLRATALVFLSTRSFIYHPNLLTLDIGAGPIFQDARFVSEVDGVRQLETSSQKTLYEAQVRATILRDKPYTGALYWEHLNPYVSVGPAQVILQENTRTGAEFSLLEPATPVPLTLEAQQFRSKGSGSDRVVDDVTDRYSLSASRTFGRVGDTRLRASTEQLDSASGSTGLPIVRSRRRNDSAGLDTRLQFGADDKYRLTNVLSYNELSFEQGQVRPADRRDLRGFLDLRARHTPRLLTYATVDGSESRQEPLTTRTASGVLGSTWQPAQDLSLTLEARGDDLRTDEFTATTRGGLAAATYEFPLLAGRMVGSYSARYDDRQQSAQTLTTPVIGERVVLAGISFVPLARPRVVGASIRVTNEARTQEYVLGRDYLISVLGEETRLQRIVTGDITDGQTVLVDYVFEVGGSFSYTQLDQTANLQWNWRQYFSVYVRWFDSQPRLTEGVPLRTLNTVRSTLVGARTDFPIARLLYVGGSVEAAKRDETILPSTSRGADVYLQIDEALIGQGGMRVSARRQKVEFENAIGQDVDLTGWDVRYWTYTGWGIELQADWSRDTDSGGLIERRRDFGSLRARWRFRQLLASLDVTRTRETQGAVQTTRTGGTFLLQRNF